MTEELHELIINLENYSNMVDYSEIDRRLKALDKIFNDNRSLISFEEWLTVWLKE